MAKRLTAKDLIKKGVPAVLILGFLAAQQLGWNGKVLEKVNNYLDISRLFPASGYVSQVEDGDTFSLSDGIRVRLIGINAPERGQKSFSLARGGLANLIIEKKVYLEYDRYQDDKFGRVLAWVWVDCESAPQFLPANYMHKSGNQSNVGLTDNPVGCKKGRLINEELIRSHLAISVVYADRAPLKYEKRILSPQSP